MVAVRGQPYGQEEVDQIAAEMRETRARSVSDRERGTVAGDVPEWLCERCHTIHPHKAGDRFTAVCPSGHPVVPTSPNLREIERLRARVVALERDTITEHGERMSGGGFHVRASEADVPGLEDIYPLEQWIRSQQRFGGKVYRRKIIVVEDWTEVPR